MSSRKRSELKSEVGKKNLRNEPYPIYDPWDGRYIYLHEWLKFLANVGKQLVNKYIYIYLPSHGSVMRYGKFQPQKLREHHQIWTWRLISLTKILKVDQFINFDVLFHHDVKQLHNRLGFVFVGVFFSGFYLRNKFTIFHHHLRSFSRVANRSLSNPLAVTFFHLKVLMEQYNQNSGSFFFPAFIYYRCIYCSLANPW